MRLKLVYIIFFIMLEYVSASNNKYINIPCGLMNDGMILKYKSFNINGYTGNYVDIYSVINNKTELKEIILYLYNNKPITKMAVTQKLINEKSGVYVLSETIDFPGDKKTRNYYTPMKALCGKIPKKFKYNISSKNQLGEDIGLIKGKWIKIRNKTITVPAGTFNTEVFKSISEYIVTNRSIPSAITKMVNTIYVNKKLGIVKMQFNTSQFIRSDPNTPITTSCNKISSSFTKELVSYSVTK